MRAFYRREQHSREERGALDRWAAELIQLEERDLVGHFGEENEACRASVGMLAPGLGKRHAGWMTA